MSQCAMLVRIRDAVLKWSYPLDPPGLTPPGTGPLPSTGRHGATALHLAVGDHPFEWTAPWMKAATAQWDVMLLCFYHDVSLCCVL